LNESDREDAQTRPDLEGCIRDYVESLGLSQEDAQFRKMKENQGGNQITQVHQ